MSDDKKFITDDNKMNIKGKVDPVDCQILEAVKTGKGAIPITSIEQLQDLARAAKATHDYFMEQVIGFMTREKAEFVRRLRVDEGYSWRAVARECSDAWKGDWSPPSNQIMGMCLCDVAARVLGEDFNKEPWN